MKISVSCLLTVLMLATIGYSQTGNQQMDSLRRKVAGIRYDEHLTCDKSFKHLRPGQRSYVVGCNKKEFDADYWVTLRVQSSQFEFSEDGVAHLAEIQGRPDERTGGIRWTCEGKPAWVRVSEDGMEVTYSCNRPPDDRDFRPEVRYNYEIFRVGR